MTKNDSMILALLFLAPFFCLTCAEKAIAADYPIQPAQFTQVKIQDQFFKPRLDTNRDVTVRYVFLRCQETGRLDNFAKAGGLIPGEFEGIYFNDSDVFKAIEGASYSLATAPDPELDEYLDKLIAKIEAAQEKDGYLYTIRTIDPAKASRQPGVGKERWSHLLSSHELYNVGHLYEAAVAHFQATGKRTLLNVAIKNAELVLKEFGPQGRKDVPGHQEIEIGLVRLFRVTGNKKYLELAKFFLDQRGGSHRKKNYGAQHQDHQPVTEQREAVGHAVRAGYMYSAMADIAALENDADYAEATRRLWENVVFKKMYLTGGIGSTHQGERFTGAYDLPNNTAYNETCAAIANMLWNQRMFLLHGDAKYIDVLERILYNGFLSGISLSGKEFFYPNPLSCDGRFPFNQGKLGRSAWFGTSCCPVNIVRFLPSLPSYIYAQRDDEIYVNLFIGSEGKLSLGKNQITLKQQTDYPWSGQVDIQVEPSQSENFTIKVRIPGWVQGEPVPGDLYRYLDDAPAKYKIKVNGKSVEQKLQNGYVALSRNWQKGDLISIDFPMSIRRVVSHPDVKANHGRVALERGPIVYCLEATDHEGAVSDLFLPDDVALEARFDQSFLENGSVQIHAMARQVFLVDEKLSVRSAPVTAIPYHLWAHREAGEMAVWLPRQKEQAIPQSPPTIASAGKVSASFYYSHDSPKAMNDRVEPESSSDQKIPRMTWWDHRGTKEWIQLDFDKKRSVSSTSIYWFDDTGSGQCRVPESWTLLYQDGENWKPVQSDKKYGTSLDQYNTVHFEPVETTALRVIVHLKPSFSGGVLEWKVSP